MRSSLAASRLPQSVPDFGHLKGRNAAALKEQPLLAEFAHCSPRQPEVRSAAGVPTNEEPE